MTDWLSLRDVVVRRSGNTILQVPSLSVAAGETVAVLGPNGAGKSMLLRTAALLLSPTHGQVTLAGKPADERRMRELSAAVLQRPLLRRGNVLDNAASGLRFRGVPRRQAREEAMPWLERFGITHLAQRSARSLSGGEAQRVSVARALATRPQLLLLDEPFSAVDGSSRGALVTDIRDVVAEHHLTMMLVTHDRREAAALAERSVVLTQGRIVADDATRHILNDPSLTELIGGDSILDTALAARLATDDPASHGPRRANLP